MAVKDGDVILIEYTGYVENEVFDSTSGEIAKQLHGKEGPLVLVFGKDFIIPGLAKIIAEMNEGEEKEVEIPPQEGFGEKKKEMVKIFSLGELLKQGLYPRVGDVLEMEGIGLRGVVKSIGSGRVVIDFNHPLAGKKLRYKIKLVKILKEWKEKIKAVLKELGIKEEEIKKIEEKKIVLSSSLDEERKKKAENALSYYFAVKVEYA